MTLRDLAKTLADAGIESAKSDALTLAEHVSGMGCASLLARYDYELDGVGWADELRALAARRAAREPLQYILGKWEFYGDEYFVSPDCLIPRSETEMLVDYAVRTLPPGARIADLCCGSGCIGIAVCRNTDARCDSVDISNAALALAKKNAESLGTSDRMTFSACDVLANANADADGGARAYEYDMILSNPPYVKTREMETLAPELSYEPQIALWGGDDGMVFYRRIIEKYAPVLASGGEFIFEIGAGLKDDIISAARGYGYAARVYDDTSGLPRMAVLTRRK